MSYEKDAQKVNSKHKDKSIVSIGMSTLQLFAKTNLAMPPTM